MATRMQQRRGTADQWISTNSGQGPVLNPGEIGYESDTNKFKIGDGVNHWIDLPYFLDIEALGGSLDDYVPLTSLAEPLGVATLDESGKLVASQIPSIDEISQDAVNQALAAGTGITKTYDDEANTITIAVDSTIATKSYADNAASTAVSAVIDSAPAALDTLNELAAALGDDANYAATITNALAEKAPSANPTFTTGNAETTVAPAFSGSQGVAPATGGGSAVTYGLSGNYSAYQVGSQNSTPAGWEDHHPNDMSYYVGKIMVISGGEHASLVGEWPIMEAAIGPQNQGYPAMFGLGGGFTWPLGSGGASNNGATVYIKTASTLKTISNTELGHLDGVTSAIQTQLDAKSPIADPTFTGTVNVSGGKITNLANPEADSDAVNKGWVISAAYDGINIHSSETTNVHGISNSQDLVYTTDERLTDERVPNDGSVSTSKIANTSVTAEKLATSSVVSDKIDSSAVTTDKIATSAVTAEKINDASVTSDKIEFAAVTTDKIADDSVTTAKIADSNITESKINDAAVTEDKIGPFAVTEGKIADLAVSSAKIAEGTIVDSNISISAAISQSKIDGLATDLGLKAPADAPTFTGTVVLPSTTSIGSVTSAEIETLSGITASAAEINYLVNASSNIQEQIDEKAPLDSPTFTTKVNIDTNNLNVGSDSEGLRTTDEYINPIAVFSTAATDYAQVVVKNTTDSANASSDLILYASNGVDSAGYIDIGITSPTFSDPDFTITGPNDGYIFMEAPEGTSGDGNLVLATGANGVHNHIVFAAGGLQSNNTQMTIFPDDRVHIEIDSPSISSTTGALTVVGGVGIQGDLFLEGNLDVDGQVDLSGVNVLPIGPGAKTFSDTLTNPTVVAVTDHNDYAQIAHQNTNSGSNASTDIIMYPNNGADDAGYVNMGITSSGFNDPDFTITGPNDGYIFMVAPDSTTGNGDLVLATGNTGARNAIVFAAGGLASDNEQMTIIPDDRVHIEIDSPSTSPTTGALTVVGGVGIQGDLNIEGNVSIEGTIVFGGAGTTVEASNLSVTDPLIFVGDGNTSDIVDLGLIGEYTVGSDIKYAGIVRDASDGVVKAFKDASTRPTSSVNFAEAGLAYADLHVAGITASSLTVGDISNTEIGYLDGVTSPIQTQLDGKLATETASSTYETISNVSLKAPINNPTFTGSVTIPKLNMGDNGINIEGIDPILGGAFTSNIAFSGGTLYANGNRLAIDESVAPKASPTFTGTVTVAANGIAFTDKTQTKAGVPSLTTIGSAIASNATLDGLGTDAQVRDSLIPLEGAVNISFESTGNAKYAIGSSINFYQSSGTGANITGSGVTILATPGATLRTTYSSVIATKVGSSTWLLAGDLKV